MRGRGRAGLFGRAGCLCFSGVGALHHPGHETARPRSGHALGCILARCARGVAETRGPPAGTDRREAGTHREDSGGGAETRPKGGMGAGRAARCCAWPVLARPPRIRPGHACSDRRRSAPARRRAERGPTLYGLVYGRAATFLSIAFDLRRAAPGYALAWSIYQLHATARPAKA